MSNGRNRKASQNRIEKNKVKEGNEDGIRTRWSGLERGGNETLEDQVKDFTNYFKYITDYICKKVKVINTIQVFPDVIPGSLRKRLPDVPPESRDEVANILKFYDEFIFPTTLHWKHPNFYAYFPGGNGFPNIIGDMLSTAIGGVGFSWTSQPSLTELENVMMDWMRHALQLPKFFSNLDSDGRGGGCIQNTASDAIFSSILAARYLVLEDEGVYSYDKNGNCKINRHPGSTLAKLVCYVNQEAHSCVIKGAQVALCTIRVLKPNEHDAIDGKILHKQIKEDLAMGLIPFYCCASLGTTGGCAFDDLKTIGPLCRRYGIWLHVDAAYGGNAFICPEFRFLKKGIKYAQSMEVNPYKFLMGSIDCSCMWIRDIKRYKRAYQINSTYMYDEFKNERDKDDLYRKNEIDYRHYGIPLSRRMRSLKLYCLLRHYGISGLQGYVRNAVKCAKHFESLVRADSRFEVSNEVYLALVCFRQKPTKREARSPPPSELSFTDKQNTNLLLRINKSRKIHMVPGTLKGNYVIRFSVNYEHATIEMMNEAWNIIQSHYVTDLDKDVARSADEIHRIAQLSFLKPVSRQSYEAYMSRRSFTIPMTFGPIIVPADDKHIVGLLSLKRQNPIKLASDNDRKALLAKSDSTSNQESEMPFENFKIKDAGRNLLLNDSATIPKLNNYESNILPSRKSEEDSDNFVINSSDDDENPTNLRSRKSTIDDLIDDSKVRFKYDNDDSRSDLF